MVHEYTKWTFQLQFRATRVKFEHWHFHCFNNCLATCWVWRTCGSWPYSLIWAELMMLLFSFTKQVKCSNSHYTYCRATKILTRQSCLFLMSMFFLISRWLSRQCLPLLISSVFPISSWCALHQWHLSPTLVENVEVVARVTKLEDPPQHLGVIGPNDERVSCPQLLHPILRKSGAL